MRRKSNLNARSRKARRQQQQRAHLSAEQIAARNEAQRIRTAERRMQETPEQHDERLRINRFRAKVARKQHITTFRERERKRQRICRARKRASFLPKDMENYMQYRLMGPLGKIRMKPDCLPSKFECQPDRIKRTAPPKPRSAVSKRRRLAIMQDIYRNETETQKKLGTSSISTAHKEPLLGLVDDSYRPTGMVYAGATGAVLKTENDADIDIEETRLIDPRIGSLVENSDVTIKIESDIDDEYNTTKLAETSSDNDIPYSNKILPSNKSSTLVHPKPTSDLDTASDNLEDQKIFFVCAACLLIFSTQNELNSHKIASHSLLSTILYSKSPNVQPDQISGNPSSQIKD